MDLASSTLKSIDTMEEAPPGSERAIEVERCASTATEDGDQYEFSLRNSFAVASESVIEGSGKCKQQICLGLATSSCEPERVDDVTLIQMCIVWNRRQIGQDEAQLKWSPRQMMNCLSFVE